MSNGGNRYDILFLLVIDGETDQTRLFRGSTSRNKVSVGEPAEGSCRFRDIIALRKRSCGDDKPDAAGCRIYNICSVEAARDIYVSQLSIG